MSDPVWIGSISVRILKSEKFNSFAPGASFELFTCRSLWPREIPSHTPVVLGFLVLMNRRLIIIRDPFSFNAFVIIRDSLPVPVTSDERYFWHVRMWNAWSEGSLIRNKLQAPVQADNVGHCCKPAPASPPFHPGTSGRSFSGQTRPERYTYAVDNELDGCWPGK